MTEEEIDLAYEVMFVARKCRQIYFYLLYMKKARNNRGIIFIYWRIKDIALEQKEERKKYFSNLGIEV